VIIFVSLEIQSRANMKNFILITIILSMWSCDNSTEPEAKDCAGVVDGTAIIDDCGVCDGDGTSCISPEEQANCNSNYAGYWSYTGHAYFENADCTGEYTIVPGIANDQLLNADCTMNYMNSDGSTSNFPTTWSSNSEYIITRNILGDYIDCIIYSESLYICTNPEESSCDGTIFTKLD